MSIAEIGIWLSNTTEKIEIFSLRRRMVLLQSIYSNINHGATSILDGLVSMWVSSLTSVESMLTLSE